MTATCHALSANGFLNSLFGRCLRVWLCLGRTGMPRVCVSVVSQRVDEVRQRLQGRQTVDTERKTVGIRPVVYVPVYPKAWYMHQQLSREEVQECSLIGV